MKPQKAVTDILEEVCTEICTHYCKYPEECERKAAGDGDLDSAMLEEICNKCPLAEL